MKVEQVTETDLDSAVKLFNAYRVFYGHPSNLTEASEFITERYTNGESVIFLAKDSQGEAIGFMQLYPSFSSVSVARTWILNDLFVEQAYRGQGVGKQLLSMATAHAKKTGAKGIALETARDNYGAQKLYESLGYEKDTRYLNYFLSV